MPGRLVDFFQSKIKQRHCTLGAGTVLLRPSRVENYLKNREAICVGSNCRIAGQLLVFAHGGCIEIGDDCFVGEGSRIWSANHVKIGNRVLISHGVNLHDTNSHSNSAKARHRHIRAMFDSGHPSSLMDVPDRPIVVEDDAWIGFNAIVLKGVRIGCGAIIGAGAIVCDDVPPYSIVVGNPARSVGTSSQ